MSFCKKLLLPIAFTIFSPITSGQSLLITNSIEKTIDARTYVRMGVAEALVGIDNRGRLIPRLAKEWSVNNEKTVWTISLRKNVYFSNGEPLTATSVVNALKMAQLRDTPLKKSPIISIKLAQLPYATPQEPPIISMKMTQFPDTLLNKSPIISSKSTKNQIIITVSKAYAVLPEVLAHYSSVILATESYNKTGEIVKTIGTGAFITKDVKEKRLIVSKNKDYWGKKAKIKKAEYVLMPSSKVSSYLKNNAYDAVISYDLNAINIMRLSKNQDLTASSVIRPQSIFLKINQQHPFLEDVRVRKALSLAIDRNSMAFALLRAPEIETSQLFPPSLSAWHNAKLQPLPLDDNRAINLLKEAGFYFDEDGYAYKLGKYFSLNMQAEKNDPLLIGIQMSLVTQLEKIGIKVRITHHKNANKAFANSSVSMLIVSRDYTDIQSLLARVSEDFDSNTLHWSSTSFSTALNFLKLGSSDIQAKKHRATITKVIQNELPVIPVLWQKQAVLSSKRLKNFTLNPYNSDYRINQLEIIPKKLTP